MSEKNKLESLTEEIAVKHFREALASGKHWYLVLLESIGLWTKTSETYKGREYQYLIDGEAFDWLLLAERLCQAVNGLLPEEDKTALIFYGETPLNLSAEQFKKLIGEAKYHQYLNFFYGVTVEEALVSSVQEEIRKERVTSGYSHPGDYNDEAYRRIYGATRSVLLRRFRQERSYPQVDSISIGKLKEFTYWLFKYRLEQCDKCRVASDTKKGLDYLKRQMTSRTPRRMQVKPPRAVRKKVLRPSS